MLNNLAAILGDGVAASTTSFESIATVTVGAGGASSITFSSIPQGFQHLQVRLFAKGTSGSDGGTSALVQFNGDTTSGNYYTHQLYGDGSTVTEFAGGGGGGGTTNTGSLLTTASFSNPNLTFVKGNGSTFTVDISSLKCDQQELDKTEAIFKKKFDKLDTLVDTFCVIGADPEKAAKRYIELMIPGPTETPMQEKSKDEVAFKAQKQFQFPEVNRGNLDINDSTFMEMMTNAFGMK